jgi:hypothetical protein
MTEATFSNVTVSRLTATIVEDLLTLDSVDNSNGNGSALSFVNNSATPGLHLALGRVSASRVNPTTIRMELAVVNDPTVSSGDDTPPLLSLVSETGGRSVRTPAGSTVALGGTLTVSGNTTFSGSATIGGTLSASGAATLSGTLTVGGAATLSGTLTVGGAATLSGVLTVGGAATLSGALTVAGSVGIGTAPGFKLDVADRVRLRQAGSPSAGLWLFQDAPAKDQAFIGMATDTSVGFWGNTGIGWGLTMDTSNGNLVSRGSLSLPNSENGLVTFTGRKYSNESAMRKNNLKLVMGSSGLIFQGQQGLEYEFAIGHTSLFFGGIGGQFSTITTNFNKVFSVNQRGDAYFAGGKTGYVVDHFVNRVGDTLELGDVVVISQKQASIFTGTDNNIPLPEVDLTEQAYDRRVCGIVARVVTEGELPHVEPAGGEAPPDTPIDEDNQQPYIHPLSQLAAAADAARTQVADQQLGAMVTLGAFAHCKVDADIAPIEVGDLLTTSPTRGHAQKVLEPERATGAIIAKALAPLAQGRGAIPVMVMLQ